MECWLAEMMGFFPDDHYMDHNSRGFHPRHGYVPMQYAADFFILLQLVQRNDIGGFFQLCEALAATNKTYRAIG